MIKTSKNKLLLSLVVASCIPVFSDWTQYARVVGFMPSSAEPDIEAFLDWAESAGANTVVIRQNVVSEYDWLLKRKYADVYALQTLDKVIRACHARSMYAVVNLSALSVKTKMADLDQNSILDEGQRSLYGDNPNWVQENKQGAHAVFYNKTGPEVEPEDESAWVSPMSDEYKNLFFPLVKSVAALLPDGISFENLHYYTEGSAWENAWAPFDEVSVSNFSGTVPSEAAIGDFSNSDFRAWLTYRQISLNVFAEEAVTAVREIHTGIKTMMIAKGGLDNRTAAYGYDLPWLADIFDGMIYDYSPLGKSTTMNTYEWMYYYAGVKMLVDLNPAKATWVIGYANGSGTQSPDAKETPERVQTLVQTIVQAGANQWTTGGVSKYNSSTDLGTTYNMNTWISSHQEWLYGNRSPAQSVAVYFSPASLLYRSGDKMRGHLASLYGTLMILNENNISSHVITSKDLNNFDRLEMPMVVLPDVACASTAERDSMAALADYYEAKVLVTGTDDNNCDEMGAPTAANFNRPFVKFLTSLSATKAKDYFHASVFSEEGDGLVKAYPQQAADTMRTTFNDEMKYSTKISFNVFELPSSTAIRAVKSQTSTYYHMMNFGGLDDSDTPREINEEIILTRNGDSLGVIGYEVSGGELNVLTNHKPAYNLQEITLTEDVSGVAAVIQATLEGEPDVTGTPGLDGDPDLPPDPPVVIRSDGKGDPLEITSFVSSFKMSPNVFGRGQQVNLKYKDGSNSIDKVAVVITDMKGAVQSVIPLERHSNVFSRSVHFGEADLKSSGTYAYNVVSEQKKLSQGVLVLK